MPGRLLVAFVRSTLTPVAPLTLAVGAANLGGIQKRNPLLFALLPPKTASDLHTALGQIFSKVSSGQMDVRMGRSLGYIASVLVKTTELSDHEIRLRAIEQMINSIKSGGPQE